MGASSVTGSGQGNSGKATLNDLSILANGPSILIAGSVELAEDEILTSPPTGAIATVTFPKAFPGNPSLYGVFITGLNAGTVQIATRTTDDDGNFSGFTLTADYEGDVMYMVTKLGVRASIA